MTYEEVKNKLRGVRGKTALCPAHDDNKQSLSHSCNDGKILLHCHAGCTIDEIVNALGIKTTDLFEEEPEKKSTMNIVAKYSYFDENKNLAYQVVRLSPKSFRQRRPDGKGGWLWNMRGIKPLPYKLLELKAALANSETVFVVEGEKDADNLAALGLTATCNHGGAGKWTQAHSEYFKAGVNVVILPDNDESGREHAAKVANQLMKQGCRVKVVDLPGLQEKGDVSDWLAAGGTKKELLALVNNTAHWEPGTAKVYEIETQFEIDADKLKNAGAPQLDEWPDGLFRDYIDYFSQATDAPHEFLFCSALQAASTACGHDLYYLKYGAGRLYSNLWLLLIAGSSFFRKTTALMRCKDVLQAARPAALMPDRLTPESFYESLSTNPAGLFVISEFGAFLASFAKSYMTGFKADLTELYDCPAYFKRRRKNKRGEVVEFTIDRPIISIFAGSTIDWLVETLKDSDAGSGFLPRFLFCAVTERRNKIQIMPRAVEAAPPELIKQLDSMSKIMGNIEFNEKSRAYKTYESFFMHLMEELNNCNENKTVMAGFISRLQTYALKLALVFEAAQSARNESTVVKTFSTESMTWACCITDYFYKNMRYLLKNELLFTEADKMRKKVFDIMRQNGGSMKSRDLMRKLRMMKKQFDEIVDTLTATGELIEVDMSTTAKGGRPGKKLVLADVIKKANPQ